MVVLHLAPSLVPLFTLGLVGIGMASWLDGDDEETGGEEDGEFGMDDDFEVDDFDDDFGGMDDMEGGEASVTELENRIEDLENEIANVSSTANTVRSENEQISEKVDEVQENVRKLLEIYEMVTRGVNPFVDDVGGDMGMGGGDGGGFGLFADADEEPEPEDEDLDDDLASAEAEDFFDDDAFDEIDEGEMEEAALDDSMGEEFGDDMGEFEMDEEADDGGETSGGTSFEELKAEYESGDADWAEDELKEEGDGLEDSEDIGFGDDETDGDDLKEEGVSDDDLFQEDDLVEADDGAQSEEEMLDEESDDEDGEMTDSSGVQTETEENDSTQPSHKKEGEVETIGGFKFGTPSASTTVKGPYLDAPPNGYLADVVVLEWMDFLLSDFDARNTVRAINYYNRIGWIGDDMREYLLSMLMGLTDSDYLYREEFGATDLSMNDHMTSLEYIEVLSSGNLDRAMADRLDTLSP